MRKFFACLEVSSAEWRQRCDPSCRHAVRRRIGCSGRNVGWNHGIWCRGCLADACSDRWRSEDGVRCVPFGCLWMSVGHLWLWCSLVEHRQHGQGRCEWVWDLKSTCLRVCLDGIHWPHGMSPVEEFHVAYLILCTSYLILSKPHKRPDKADWYQIEWFSHRWEAMVGDPGICRCMQTCRNAAKMPRED